MNIFKPLFSAVAVLCATSVLAVPAPRHTYHYTQPDGTEISLTLVGDEFCHYYLTDDNLPVMAKGDSYYFACKGFDGMLAPSSVLATNSDNRSATQNQFLSTISSESITEAIIATREASPLYVERKFEIGEDGLPRVSRSENTSSGIGLMPGYKFPTSGDVRSVVILVEYADVPFSVSDEETFAYFNGLLNTPGFSEKDAIGSAWDYFNDASCGKFNPTFDVLGPVTLPNNREFYGGNTGSRKDPYAYKMVTDAADILAAQGVDFSVYDNDNNGVVDNVFVFYAGIGEAFTDSEPNSVWPHQSELSYYVGNSRGYKVGETYLNNYACSSELLDTNGTIDGIGTFCHEFSHVFGLPDLYDTANNGTFTPGPWSLMDSGSYNGRNRVPPTYSVFERNALGWIDLTVIDSPMDLTLNNIMENNEGCVVLSSTQSEFFLLENRQQVKWDSKLPHHGMLIWHITYNAQRWQKNIVNTIETKQYVDLVEANGKTGTNSLVYKTYPFPGSRNITEFNGFTTWNKQTLEFPLTEIKENGGVITAKVAGGAQQSSISSITANSSLRAEGLSLKADEPFDLYDSMGRLVSRESTHATVATPGIYVAVMNGKASKIALK